jgi:hypothetical protein
VLKGGVGDPGAVQMVEQVLRRGPGHGASL